MLCLTMHEGDHHSDIIIDLRKVGLGLVEINCERFKGKSVMLGFEADKDVRIYRRSVWERMHREVGK